MLTATAEGLPTSCRLLDTIADAPVLVVTTAANAERTGVWRQRGAGVAGLPELNVKSVLTELGRRGMTNVLVEGGAGTLGAFRDAGEIDEIHAFMAPKLFGGTGALSPIGGLGVAELDEAWTLPDWEVERVGADILVHGSRQPPA